MITVPVPVTLNLPLHKAPRSVGVHVSSAIRIMATRKGYLKRELVEDLSLIEVDQESWWNNLAPLDKLRMSIGLAWEEWYIREQLPDVIDHPGEMIIDGIYMTHDGESLDTILTAAGEEYHLCCHEVKTTSKSIKTIGDLSSQWMWMTQTKAYCKGLGTRFAHLHVLALYGDYKYPMQPQVRRWQVEFSQDEIDATWDEILETVRNYQETV